MGGLITRQVINDNGKLTGYDADDQKYFTVKVDKVVMLGTPNAGTLLADTVLAHLLGTIPNWLYHGMIMTPTWDSTKQMKRAYVRHTFNQSIRGHPIRRSFFAQEQGVLLLEPYTFSAM